MLVSTKGIVLKSFKYSETSFISKVYTQELGVRSLIISGVRKAKARFGASLLQPLSILDLEIYHKKDREVDRIKEAKLDYIFTEIPFDIIKSSIALFISEILYKSIKEEETNELLYIYLDQVIRMLDEQQGILGNIPLFFLLSLSSYLGFYPSNNYSNIHRFFDLTGGTFSATPPIHKNYLDGEEAKHLNELLNAAREGYFNLSMPLVVRQQLMKNLLRYYGMHVNNFMPIHSVEVMRTVLYD